jgi:hypothetical protein
MEYLAHARCLGFNSGAFRQGEDFVTDTGVSVSERLQPGNRISKLKSAYSWFLALSSGKVLLCFYLFFCLLRIACAFITTKTPVIMPDSALYLHLSRSIFEKGALLFRGQPIRYEYILYPLILSPLHLLPEGVSLFRAAQVVNVLIMHLSVFPVYGLARALTRSHPKGLLVALLTMLMPDFLITGHIMAESIAFPLILTTFYVYYKTYGSPFSFGKAALWGGLGFLLYTLKPGYAAIPSCFFALIACEALRTKRSEWLYQALAGALSMLCFMGLYTLFLRFGLHLHYEQSTIYGSQTHPFSLDHLLQTFNGLIMYSVFVPLAFSIFPLYLPAAGITAFEGQERHLLKTVLLSLLAILIGTVYVIYYDELNGSDPYTARIHVRYVAAFLPVLLAYALSPALAGKRMNTTLFILLAFSLVSLMRWNGQVLLSGNNYPVDAMLLTTATTQTKGFNGRILWPMAALIFLLVLAYRMVRYRYGSWERRALCAFIAFSFILNGALSFALNRYHNDSVLPGEAVEAVKMADFARSLGVVRDGACLWPEAAELDIASRCTLPVVELDDLIEHANPDGSLTSFTPISYWQENAVNPISSPDWLILTNDILNAIILTDEARAAAVSTSSGGYCVLPVTLGRPIIHSGLSGLNEGWVQAGSRFTLFDETVRAKGSITLQLQARAGEGQAQLTLRCGSQDQSFTLTDSLQWIEATFAVEDPNDAVTVTFQNEGNIFIRTYLIT